MTASKLNLSESGFKLEKSPSIVVGATKLEMYVVLWWNVRYMGSSNSKT